MDKRELKFRVWWGKNSKRGMEYTGDWAYYFEEEGIQHFSTADIMQYIGLQDKNGKEIYEGDIIKYSDKWVKDRIYKVPLLRDCFLTNLIGYEIENRTDVECEVIGNEFETPELLPK